MLTWPREIPFDGEPADVHDIVADYSAWLATSTVPKLLIDVSDGDTLTGELLDLARTFPNQAEIIGDRTALRAGGQPGRDRSGARRLDRDARTLSSIADQRPASSATTGANGSTSFWPTIT